MVIVHFIHERWNQQGHAAKQIPDEPKHLVEMPGHVGDLVSEYGSPVQRKRSDREANACLPGKGMSKWKEHECQVSQHKRGNKIYPVKSHPPK